MKILLFVFAGILLAACKKTPPPPPPKQAAVDAIPVPENTTPPVDSVPFEDGYAAGDPAGVLAGKSDPRPRNQRMLPDENQLAVLALEAAGDDPAKGPKWQSGFISGYRDGFVRAVEGKR